MTKTKLRNLVTCALMSVAFEVAIPSRAAMLWDGPLISYNQPAPDPTQTTNQDRITPDVWLTRASSGGLFNAALETAATNDSPAGTEWAFGTLDNYASLPYTNWLGWLNGKSPTTMVGSNVVVHLIFDDIYLSFKFSLWASKGAGGFAYQRSTPLLPVIFAQTIQVDSGQFYFSYSADPGAGYVVQSSTNLTDWLPLVTNTAVSSLTPFSDPLGPAGAKYYQVKQLADP